jgi:PEP-CTERM motif
MTAFGLKLNRSIAAILFAAITLGGGVAQGSGTTLWYNGNSDGRDALANQTGAADGLIYDEFIVPSGYTFTITGVFSNDAMNKAATTAYWEIRSGVSAGNGGTLLAHGDGTDTLTSTGQTFSFGGLNPETIENNLVQGLNVTLGAGTYWLAVAPDVSNQNSYIVTTSGAGAVGHPAGNDGNSFISSTFFSMNFVPTSDPSVEGPGTWDYSMGIIGTSVQSVPEPSSVILGLAGMVIMAGSAWIRRRNRS